jgi:nitroreductase
MENQGLNLLKSRRSIRNFEDRPIDDAILTEIFNACRYCFSAVNRQPWKFIVIRNKEMIQKVAKECTTGPFAADAPILVALIGDTIIQPEWYVHDMCFVSLQLALAAWTFGIGTCWIGRINRKNVKKILGLPEEDYLLTVLPLGYPKGAIPDPRPRKALNEIVRYID